MNTTTKRNQPTSDRARRLVIIRTDDPKADGTTHRHSGCGKCLKADA